MSSSDLHKRIALVQNPRGAELVGIFRVSSFSHIATQLVKYGSTWNTIINSKSRFPSELGLILEYAGMLNIFVVHTNNVCGG